jgi:hypothetical protein
MDSRPIFLSYSREDGSVFVKKLVNDLREAGANIWFDGDILASRYWDREIEAALNGADTVLFVMSGKSVVSNNVMDEIGLAIDSGKQVIPLLLTACPIPFRVRRLQYIDFTSNYGEGFEKLLKDLNGAESEVGFWKKIDEAGTEEDYSSYLHRYPSGRYVQQARDRIDGLRNHSSVLQNQWRIAIALSVSLLLMLAGVIWYYSTKPVKQGAFECSNLSQPDTLWVVRGKVIGDYILVKENLTLKLATGWMAITGSKRLREKNLRITSIRPSIISYSASGTQYYDYLAKGEKIVINKVLNESDTLKLDPVRLSIILPGGVDLNKCWINFEVVVTSDNDSEGIVSLQSAPDVF